MSECPSSPILQQLFHIGTLFHTKLERLESTAEQEKALHDIVCAVKRNSYERDSAQLGTDVAALNRVIAGKKQLEELAKTHISLE